MEVLGQPGCRSCAGWGDRGMRARVHVACVCKRVRMRTLCQQACCCCCRHASSPAATAPSVRQHAAPFLLRILRAGWLNQVRTLNCHFLWKWALGMTLLAPMVQDPGSQTQIAGEGENVARGQ